MATGYRPDARLVSRDRARPAFDHVRRSAMFPLSAEDEGTQACAANTREIANPVCMFAPGLRNG